MVEVPLIVAQNILNNIIVYIKNLYNIIIYRYEFLGNKFNILGLILLAIVVLSLVIPYKEGLEETQTPKNLEQQAELAQQNDESNQFIGDVINAEAGKRMPDIQNGLDEDSKFIDVKVSEDDIPKIVECQKYR